MGRVARGFWLSIFISDAVPLIPNLPAAAKETSTVVQNNSRNKEVMRNWVSAANI